MVRRGWFAILMTTACAKGQAPSTPMSAADAPMSAAMRVRGAAPADPLRDGDGQLRPEATAGMYWQPYVTCHDCAVPTALVAYLAPDAQTARAVVRALDGRLGLGLPYVIHTDQLASDLRGLAVITGAFSTHSAAATAAEDLDPIAGLAPTLISVEEYWAEAPRHVTVIDRGGPVPAWSQADVQAVDEALDASSDPDARATLASQRRWVMRALRERAPACTVQPGDLFVALESELDWYRFAPVRCGGGLAYVPWTSTLLGHAVIVPDGAGGHRLHQIVGAECDSPIVEEWRYDRGGRHELPPADVDPDAQLALGGC